ncbi:MAG: M14 family zinc carboxypeptidase, partial [Flavobacteriaceae bacterium]
GNESVSTEASMRTLYELLTSKSDYLDNTVVIIDPCINPDGRDRYVNWYHQYKNSPNNVDPNSKEHHEGWLTGRTNHYMFDLNRDWAWLSQIESQQRIKFYNQWLPHVHVDFHEQGVNSPYYFAPAAEPYHEVITDFQRDFQKTIGKNHAKYFDANGWFYFTKEVFDLFYPSYGDTYPMYSGSIGMTYEQGGSGRAGLGITTQIGDTLTLGDRIDHHATTGMSTIETASQHAERLNDEFRKFYQNRDHTYKSYVLSGNSDQIQMLTALLDQHQIEYGFGKGSTIKGHNYSTGQRGTAKATGNSLIVGTDQPKSTLVKVLFEPNAKLSDSLTYDITAWSLPYAYGLKTIASEDLVPSLNTSQNKGITLYEGSPSIPMSENDYAYVTDWNSMHDARFLAQLLQNRIRVRFAERPFSLHGKTHERGSLIIVRSDNKHHTDLNGTLSRLASEMGKSLDAVSTGFVDNGKDFGSYYVKMIQAPKIALLSGEPANPYRFGEIWHFFEQQLHYPVTVVEKRYFDMDDLKEYDILILPDGRGYRRFLNDNALKDLKAWVADGGKLIAMGNAIGSLGGENGFDVKAKKTEVDTAQTKPISHEALERQNMKRAITGAIFKTKVDPTHPLAYGYGHTYFTLKLGTSAFDYLKTGTAVFLEKETKPVSGFAGSLAQKNIEDSMVFGVEDHGRGQVIYMVDNPLFRAFWENGKLFFANALFMVH